MYSTYASLGCIFPSMVDGLRGHIMLIMKPFVMLLCVDAFFKPHDAHLTKSSFFTPLPLLAHDQMSYVPRKPIWKAWSMPHPMVKGHMKYGKEEWPSPNPHYVLVAQPPWSYANCGHPWWKDDGWIVTCSFFRLHTRIKVWHPLRQKKRISSMPSVA